MTTEKELNEVAAILRGEYETHKHDRESRQTVENLVASLADTYARLNPRFDRERFYQAALGRTTVREQS